MTFLAQRISIGGLFVVLAVSATGLANAQNFSGATIYDVVATYGADPTGAKDSTNSVTAAIAACGQSGAGGVIWFRAGRYQLSSINDGNKGCHLQGAGISATVLEWNSNGNLINITSYQTNVSDLTIESVFSGQTAGFAIAYNNASFSTVHDVAILSGYDGISDTSSAELRLNRVQLRNLTGTLGIYCGGTSSVPVSGIRLQLITGGSDTSNDNANLNWIFQDQNCNSVSVSQAEFDTGGNCYNQQGGEFANVFDLECDHTQGGVLLNGGSAFYATNSFFGSALGSNNVTIATSYGGDVNITNSRVVGAFFHGILINGGRDVVINGNTIADNGVAAAKNYHGVTVGAGATRFSITNNRIGHLPVDGSTLFQAFCVFVVSGSSDFYEIAFNNCADNATGTVNDGGTGTNKVIVGNIGP